MLSQAVSMQLDSCIEFVDSVQKTPPEEVKNTHSISYFSAAVDPVYLETLEWRH